MARKRLTRITTRSGDRGDSGLADGSRRPKSDPIFTALGDVDELNSVLGVAIAALHDDAITGLLSMVQSRLFDLGGALATPGAAHDFDAEVTALEQLVDEFNAALAPLANFVLPGGDAAAAALHHARAVCRRAERSLWTLDAIAPLRDRTGIVYLNRLSDLLFVLARRVNAAHSRTEALWSPRERRSE